MSLMSEFFTTLTSFFCKGGEGREKGEREGGDQIRADGA